MLKVGQHGQSSNLMRITTNKYNQQKYSKKANRGNTTNTPDIVYTKRKKWKISKGCSS